MENENIKFTGLPDDVDPAMLAEMRSDARLIEGIMSSHIHNLIVALEASEVNQGLAVAMLFQAIYRFSERVLEPENMDIMIDGMRSLRETKQ